MVGCSCNLFVDGLSYSWGVCGPAQVLVGLGLSHNLVWSWSACGQFELWSGVGVVSLWIVRVVVRCGQFVDRSGCGRVVIGCTNHNIY